MLWFNKVNKVNDIYQQKNEKVKVIMHRGKRERHLGGALLDNPFGGKREKGKEKGG